MSRFSSTILTIVLFLFILSPVLINAQENFRQENFRAKEVAILEKDEIIDKDYFAWGERVVLSGTVNGDAYLAGGNVIVDGVVNGDLLVAGGNINILGKVSGDIRAVGGNINVAGEVDGNVTTVGGNIDIEKGAIISGSLVAACGNVQVFGILGKGATIGAGSLTLGNVVGSDVLAAVGKIDLSSSAIVNGDLTYISGTKLGMARDATVSGTIIQHIPPKVEVKEKDEILAVLNFGWSLYTFLATLLVGLILSILVPNYTKKAASLISKKPWVSMGIGLIAIILMPVLVVLLFVTAIGVPLAILLIAYFIFILFFAKIFTAVFLGEKALGFFGRKQNLFLTLIIGLIVLSILGMIPIIGGIITFIAMLAGVGAIVLAKKELFLSLRSKKQI